MDKKSHQMENGNDTTNGSKDEHKLAAIG